MRLTCAVLALDDLGDGLGRQWDALSGSRGGQADFFDSYAWIASLFSRASGRALEGLRIPAVFDVAPDGARRLVAVLPLGVRGRRAASFETGRRLRSRVVVAPDVPMEETAGLLAEAVASLGVRVLRLHRLPGRDPASHALLRALDDAGYGTLCRSAATDMLAPVPAGGWDAYRRRLPGFDRYARRYSRGVHASWDAEVVRYGGVGGKPVEDCFETYAELQARCWRGPFKEWVREERLDFLRRADLNGWARVHVLRVAGRPAAVQVWLRVGDVVLGRSTAYDQDLAPLNPGSVLEWAAQEQLLTEAEGPPALVDHLPGTTAEKERLVLERPALLEVSAVRGVPAARAVLPAAVLAGKAVKGVRQRGRVRARELRERLTGAAQGPAAPGGAVPLPGSVPPSGIPAKRLDPDPALGRYLALAGGHPGPAAAQLAWGAGWQWWCVGERGDGGAPVALVRIDPERHAVREMLWLGRWPDPAGNPTSGRLDPISALGAVASALGNALTCDDAAVIVRRPPLPWPRDAPLEK